MPAAAVFPVLELADMPALKLLLILRLLSKGTTENPGENGDSPIWNPVPARVETVGRVGDTGPRLLLAVLLDDVRLWRVSTMVVGRLR